MDRTKFYNVVTVDGIKELDFLDKSISSFPLTHTPIYYKVAEHNVARPDRISFSMYRTVQFWWVICLVNGIENPLTDIEVGTVIKIPHLSDIYEFYKRNKVR